MGGMETLEQGKHFWGQQNNPPRTQTLGPEGQVRKKGKKVAIDVNCRLICGWNEEHIYVVCHAPMSHPITRMRARTHHTFYLEMNTTSTSKRTCLL